MRILASLLCLSLSACSDWPDIGGGTARTGPWPVLLPLGEVLPAERSDDPDAATEALRSRAAGLRARAAILRRPVEDDAAFEALRARMSGL